MQLSSLISHDWRCEMGQRSAKFRLPIMLRFFALTYGASFSLLIWLMAVSTTHMRHTAPVFQWPCCHAQQQFEKIRMCFEFNYVHTHTHIHILHLHRGPIERKNMIFLSSCEENGGASAVYRRHFLYFYGPKGQVCNSKMAETTLYC